MLSAADKARKVVLEKLQKDGVETEQEKIELIKLLDNEITNPKNIDDEKNIQTKKL